MEKKNKINIVKRVSCFLFAFLITCFSFSLLLPTNNKKVNAYNDLQLFNPFYGSVTIEQSTSLESPIKGDLPSFLPSYLYNNNVIGTPPYEFRYATLNYGDYSRISIEYSSLFFENIPEDAVIFTLTFANRWLTLDELYSEFPINFLSEGYGRKQISIIYSFFDATGSVVNGIAGAYLGSNAYTQIDLTAMLQNSAMLQHYQPTYNNAYFFRDFELSVININPYSGGFLTISIPYNDYGFNNEEYFINIASYDTYFTELANGSALNWMQIFVDNVNSFLDIEMLPNFSFRDMLWLSLAIPLVMWFLKTWLGG